MSNGFEIPSNDGRQRVVGLVLATIPVRHDTLYLTRVSGSGVSSNRLPANLGSGDDVDEQAYNVELCQVMLSHQSLLDTRRQLDRWLESPGDTFCTLGDYEGQRLNLSLHRLDRWISSDQKPVCSITYNSFRLTAELRTIVDQSCVRILRRSLDWVGNA